MAASRGDHAICPPGMIINNRYKIVKECGCGNFSKVYECIDTKNDNTRCAVKFLKKEYASDASFEKDILKGLGDKDKSNNQKVAKMTDYFVYNRFPTFVFPLKGPSLRSCKLGVTRGNLPQDEMRAFAHEMLTTLKFLHKDVKMVHTDIKPENILLDASLPAGTQGIGNGWTMCDFGSASFLRPDRLDSDLISTRPYRAPEVVMGQGWSTTADIWSMGCVFFEVQAGSRLFEVHDDNDHLHAYVARLQQKIPSFFTKSSKHSSKFFGPDGSFRRPSNKTVRSMTEVLKDTPELLDLLKQMLDYDPKRRLSADECLKHPFFSGMNKTAATGRKSAEAAAAIISAAENKKAPSPPQSAPVSSSGAGAAYPAVLQERAAKVANVQELEPKISKKDVKSTAVSAAPAPKSAGSYLPNVAAGKPSSGRFAPQTNTVQAAYMMAKAQGGLPAAGRPSNSARQGTLGSGRYY